MRAPTEQLKAAAPSAFGPRGDEHLDGIAHAYNKAFQVTPQRCALGFPRPLRGLGAPERRRWAA